MKTRTTPRPRPAYRGKRREEIAARDVTLTTSEPATELPASDGATYERRPELAVALLTLDTIARGSLSVHSFERYLAYKRALLLGDQDLQSVSLTLIVFIQGLYLEHPDTTLH